MKTSKKFSYYVLPTLISSITYIVLIPITTSCLNPADFGLFALLGVYGSLITSISSLGSGYIWAYYFPRLDNSERSSFVTTVTFACFAVSVFASLLFWILWPAIVKYAGISSLEAKPFFIYVLFSAVAASFWHSAHEYLVLDSRAKAFAYISIAATFMSAIVTVIGLYVFDMKVAVLFYAAFASSVAQGLGALYVLRSFFVLKIESVWLRKIIGLGIPTMPGSIFENISSSVEKNVLSSMMSLSYLGLYTHSQRYRTMMSVGIKALSRSLWPVSLEEARAKSIDFPVTRNAWDPIYFCISMCGMVCGATSKELVSWLTHDKFTETAPYITAWLIFVCIQNIGKEHIAVLYTQNKGVYNTYLQVIVQLLYIVMLIVLIPYYGIWAAILTCLIQMAVYRTGVIIRAAMLQSVTFNDMSALVGIFFIIISLLFQIIWWDQILFRLLSNMLLIIIFMIIYKDKARSIYNMIRSRSYYNVSIK